MKTAETYIAEFKAKLAENPALIQIRPEHALDLIRHLESKAGLVGALKNGEFSMEFTDELQEALAAEEAL